MKNNKTIIIAFIVLMATIYSTRGFSQIGTDSIRHSIEKKNTRAWIAAAEVFGNNFMVNRINSLRPDGDFADVTLNSWKLNLERGFNWDVNNFPTNWIGHPFQGSTYFNSARSLGLSFGQSSWYALGGSLSWEFLGETHQASLNDVYCTTLGGMYLGEMTHRFSESLLDDRTRGFDRAWREGATILMDPMKGFNRLITGRMWHKSNEINHARAAIDTRIYSAGNFIFGKLSNNDAKARFSLAAYINYGDRMYDFETDYTPFEFFEFNATLKFARFDNRKNPYLNITGYGPIRAKQRKNKVITGWLLSYDYLNNEIAEIGSVGIPYAYMKQLDYDEDRNHNLFFNLNAAPIFASSNTELIDSLPNLSGDPQLLRDYSFSYGYRLNAEMVYNRSDIRATMNYKFFDMLVVAGPEGQERLNTLVLKVEKYFNHLSLGLQLQWYERHSLYDNFENVSIDGTQIDLLLGYRFHKITSGSY